jgi:hypothetical protein
VAATLTDKCVTQSISQNDNLNQCESPEELAVAHAEGSPAGPLLRAINAIADAIVDEFPLVAIDTLGEACFFLTSLVLYYGTRSFTKTGSGRT